MAGIYLRLLEQIVADTAAALRQRQSLPGKAKAMVAVRALAGIPERIPAAGTSAAADSAASRPGPSGSGPGGTA
jgi:hypothetical protein